MTQTASAGALYVVATPIGNLEDITLRALRALREADLIAAEDTRHTRKLLTHYGIHRPTVSYHKHNRLRQEGFLLAALRQGKKVALVTDAGTPGISDPGEHLIRRAVEEALPLVPIPGPSAFVAALSVSGLPTGSFLFYGFPPARKAARQKFLSSLKGRRETLVFYESARRLPSLLEEAREILGDRRVAVAREITKIYEEIFRGSLSQALEKFGREEVRGEVTVIMEGAIIAPGEREGESLSSALRHYLKERNLSLKEAVSRVAEELGVSRREVYREGLRLMKEEGPKEG